MPVVKKKYRNDKIVYFLTIEDLRNVADDLYLEELTNEQIDFATQKLADYMDWYDAVELAVKDAVKQNEKNS